MEISVIQADSLKKNNSIGQTILVINFKIITAITKIKPTLQTASPENKLISHSSINEKNKIAL